jgi:hypothetical protein
MFANEVVCLFPSVLLFLMMVYTRSATANEVMTTNAMLPAVVRYSLFEFDSN